MAYASKTNIIAKGTGKISLADPVAKGGKISDAKWDLFMESLKGSCTISQEEGEKSEVYVDQKDLPVLATQKAGKMTLSWKLPNTAKPIWNLLYNTVADAAMTAIYVAGAAEEVIGVKLNVKEIKKMLKIEMQQGGQRFIFPNLAWSSLVSKDNEEDPMAFTITATVLAAIDDTQPDFIIINQMDGTAAGV